MKLPGAGRIERGGRGRRGVARALIAAGCGLGGLGGSAFAALALGLAALRLGVGGATSNVCSDNIALSGRPRRAILPALSKVEKGDLNPRTPAAAPTAPIIKPTPGAFDPAVQH